MGLTGKPATYDQTANLKCSLEMQLFYCEFLKFIYFINKMPRFRQPLKQLLLRYIKCIQL